jgi:hypothetical protein
LSNPQPPHPAQPSGYAQGNQAPGLPTPVQMRNGLGVTALILGIIGALFGLIPILFFIAGPLGLAAFICGLVGRSRAKKGLASNGRMSLIGAILGLLSMVLAVVGIVIVVGAFSNAGKELEKLGDDLSSDATAEVSVTSCAKNAIGWPEANVKVTNAGDKMADYSITVAFENADGSQLDTGSAFIQDLRPGQTGTEAAAGTAETTGKFTCVVTEATKSTL